MTNKYLKEIKLHQILLFLLCGILIVLFLNYNNLNIYRHKNINNIPKVYEYVFKYDSDSKNNTDNFIDFKPITDFKIPVNSNPVITYSEGKTKYNNLYRFIRVLCPSEKEIISLSIYKTYNAVYNKLNCKSIDVINNKNNALFTEIFTINTNNLENNVNVFVSRLLDTRVDKNLPYSNNDKLIEIPLKFEYGISINIDFILQFSYSINPTNVPSKIIIKEMVPSNFLIESEKSKYKTYELESFKLEYNDINNYSLIFTLPDFTSNNKTFKHELILNLKFNNFNTSSTTYESLLGDINIFNSFMTYKIYYNNEIVFHTNIKVILNISDINGSLKDYTEESIKSIFSETLNDKYNKIITPLFLIDNDISKKEKLVNDIKKHYLLNELSNIQSNIKFFNNFS